jgi:hypothetical protein
MSERADHCHGSYVLHLYCCAPNDIVLDIACNTPGEFTGNSLKEALSAAKGAGWHTHVAGLAAWCPTHAGRTLGERCMDFAERAACTAPDWRDPDDVATHDLRSPDASQSP